MNLKSIICLGLSLLMLPLASIRAEDSAPPAHAPLPPGVTISPAASELLRMAESGVSEEVLIAYVKNTNVRFNLGADAILYLKDEGLSSEIVSEMLKHDSAMEYQPQTRVPQPIPPQPAATQSDGKYIYEQRAYPPTMLPPAPATEPQAVTIPTEPSPPMAPPPAPVPAPSVAPVAVPVAYESDAPPEVTYFYNDLAPYGTWLKLEGYGWCWQPRLVMFNRNWRPYCDGGHWLDSDAGWYWDSEYSWGWAPFHYGRWHYHEEAGWVWFPDRVWGPGWVVWRSHDEYCGWAPLPPRAEFDARLGWRFNGAGVRADFDFGLGAGLFTFVAFGDFAGHDYSHRCLRHEDVVRIYTRTVVINNYAVNDRHMVVNRGIPRERIEERGHTKIHTVAIHDEAERNGSIHGASRGVVYKHELKAPAEPPRMVAQKLDDHHPVVQHATIAPIHEEKKPVFTPVKTQGHPQVDTHLSGENNLRHTPGTFTPEPSNLHEAPRLSSPKNGTGGATPTPPPAPSTRTPIGQTAPRQNQHTQTQSKTQQPEAGTHAADKNQNTKQ